MGNKVMEEKINDDRIKVFVENIKDAPFRFLKDNNTKDIEDSVYILEQHKKRDKKWNKKYQEDDIYHAAVYQGYLDACRTMDGAGKGEKKEIVDKARAKMANEIKAYFECPEQKSMSESEENFDTWHDRRCNEFVETGYTYGHAQKILNMAFKYLYCCADIREKYEGYFTYCHMPLDGYILAWYAQDGKTIDYKDEAWSKLDEKAYKNIKNGIRNMLESEEAPCNEKVLYCEFEIWQKQKHLVEKKEIEDAVNKILKYAKTINYENGLEQSLVAFKNCLNSIEY